MTTIDAGLSAVTRALYGGTVDPGDLSKAVDAADVHVDGPVQVARPHRRGCQCSKCKTVPVRKFAPTSDDPKKQRRLAAVGLAATGVAGVAGVHALTATRGENAARAKEVEAGAYKIPKAIKAVAPKITPKKAAAIAGGGLLALHGVELVGDALGAHAQAEALKKTKRAVPVDDVAKALRVRVAVPLNPADVRRGAPTLRARRPAGSPAVTKSVFSGVRQVKGIVSSARGTAANAEKITAEGAEIAGKVKHLVPKPKTAVALGAGGIATLGAANSVSTYEGSKHGTRKAILQTGLGKSLDADVPIAKIDADQRQVFGWANVSVLDGVEVTDRQGDIFPIDELEKAAYDYVLDCRVGGDQHSRDGIVKLWDGAPKHASTLIESMVFTPEKIEKMGLPADFPQGWWIGMQVHDEPTWQLIKSGKRTGFSVHGSGRRTLIEKFDDGRNRRAVRVTQHVGIRERAHQAAHPPAVRRTATPDSSAVRSLGYQQQTRKLDVEMRSRPGAPYSYRVRPKVARRVTTADSKGKAYNDEIRNQREHHDRYTLADRGRLFVRPERQSA